MAKKTKTPVKKNRKKANGMTIPQKKKALLAELKKNHNIVSYACDKVGCSKVLFYKYKKEDDKFRAEVDAIADDALDYVESKLYENIEANDTTAMIFYLKAKGKKRGYNERIEHDVSHQIEQVVIKPFLEEGKDFTIIEPEQIEDKDKRK